MHLYCKLSQIITPFQKTAATSITKMPAQKTKDWQTLKTRPIYIHDGTGSVSVSLPAPANLITSTSSMSPIWNTVSGIRQEKSCFGSILNELVYAQFHLLTTAMTETQKPLWKPWLTPYSGKTLASCHNAKYQDFILQTLNLLAVAHRNYLTNIETDTLAGVVSCLDYYIISRHCIKCLYASIANNKCLLISCVRCLASCQQVDSKSITMR